MSRWHLKCEQEGTLEDYTRVVGDVLLEENYKMFPVTVIDNFFLTQIKLSRWTSTKSFTRLMRVNGLVRELKNSLT